MGPCDELATCAVILSLGTSGYRKWMYGILNMVFNPLFISTCNDVCLFSRWNNLLDWDIVINLRAVLGLFMTSPPADPGNSLSTQPSWVNQSTDTQTRHVSGWLLTDYRWKSLWGNNADVNFAWLWDHSTEIQVFRLKAVRCVIRTNIKRRLEVCEQKEGGGEAAEGGETQLHYCVSAADRRSGPSSHQSPDTVCHRDKCCSLLNVISLLRL